jgi:hypothetical protein
MRTYNQLEIYYDINLINKENENAFYKIFE